MLELPANPHHNNHVANPSSAEATLAFMSGDEVVANGSNSHVFGKGEHSEPIVPCAEVRVLAVSYDADVGARVPHADEVVPQGEHCRDSDGTGDASLYEARGAGAEMQCALGPTLALQLGRLQYESDEAAGAIPVPDVPGNASAECNAQAQVQALVCELVLTQQALANLSSESAEVQEILGPKLVVYVEQIVAELDAARVRRGLPPFS